MEQTQSFNQEDKSGEGRTTRLDQNTVDVEMDEAVVEVLGGGGGLAQRLEEMEAESDEEEDKFEYAADAGELSSSHDDAEMQSSEKGPTDSFHPADQGYIKLNLEVLRGLYREGENSKFIRLCPFLRNSLKAALASAIFEDAYLFPSLLNRFQTRDIQLYPQLPLTATLLDGEEPFLNQEERCLVNWVAERFQTTIQISNGVTTDTFGVSGRKRLVEISWSGDRFIVKGSKDIDYTKPLSELGSVMCPLSSWQHYPSSALPASVMPKASATSAPSEQQYTLPSSTKHRQVPTEADMPSDIPPVTFLYDPTFLDDPKAWHCKSKKADETPHRVVAGLYCPKLQRLATMRDIAPPFQTIYILDNGYTLGGTASMQDTVEEEELRVKMESPLLMSQGGAYAGKNGTVGADFFRMCGEALRGSIFFYIFTSATMHVLKCSAVREMLSRSGAALMIIMDAELYATHLESLKLLNLFHQESNRTENRGDFDRDLILVTPVLIGLQYWVHFHSKNFVTFNPSTGTTTMSIKSSNPSALGYGLTPDSANKSSGSGITKSSVEDGITLIYMEGTNEFDQIYSEMTDRLAHFAKAGLLVENSKETVDLLLQHGRDVKKTAKERAERKRKTGGEGGVRENDAHFATTATSTNLLRDLKLKLLKPATLLARPSVIHSLKTRSAIQTLYFRGGTLTEAERAMLMPKELVSLLERSNSVIEDYWKEKGER